MGVVSAAKLLPPSRGSEATLRLGAGQGQGQVGGKAKGDAMTIWCLGSINADYIYTVPHLPAPGETLPATGMTRMLGGKGANQSVAAARAGAQVRHVGAVGPDGDWVLDALAGYGVDVGACVRLPDRPTGHALVFVEPGGENSIVLFPSANRALSPALPRTWAFLLSPGDTVMLQNETDLGAEVAAQARAAGARVVYSAAPFDAEATRAMLPHIDLLILNAVEAAQLAEALGIPAEDLPVPELLVTLGADGARYRDTRDIWEVAAPPVTPVDTTGAGDTFAGWFCAARDRGLAVEDALAEAAQAAALQVTRPGTAQAIPGLEEVRAAL